jgi:hypothetical protein
MMLEVTIGETICVRMDDEMTDQRLTPEHVEDYLTRMARTAAKMYDGIADDDGPVTAIPTLDTDDPA